MNEPSEFTLLEPVVYLLLQYGVVHQREIVVYIHCKVVVNLTLATPFQIITDKTKHCVVA